MPASNLRLWTLSGVAVLVGQVTQQEQRAVGVPGGWCVICPALKATGSSPADARGPAPADVATAVSPEAGPPWSKGGPEIAPRSATRPASTATATVGARASTARVGPRVSHQGDTRT